MTDLLALADHVTSKGLDAGADEIEVFVQRAKIMEVSLKRNDMQSGQSIISSGLGIRAIKNHGLAFSAINQLDENQGKKAAEQVVKMVKKSPPSPHYALPESQPLIHVPGLYDSQSESFSIDDVLDHALQLLNTAKDYDKRITIDSGGFAAVVGERAIVTSKGIEAIEKISGFTWYLSGMAIDGTDIGSFDFEMDSAINISDINVEPTAELFSKKVLSALGAKKIKSFKGPILLTPYSTANLVLSPILFSTNAENIQKGMSRFAGQQGTQVASDQLIISDNGTRPGELGSSRFDREGQPPQPLTLIDKGFFKDIMFHAFSGNRVNRPSTGHASGSYRSAPGISATNIKLHPGDSSQSEIISEIKHGILATRLSGGPHPLSGDFSAVVKGGMLIQNGEIQHAVKELIIQGNVYETLGSISLISNETRKLANVGASGGSTLEAPYIVLDDVSITS